MDLAMWAAQKLTLGKAMLWVGWFGWFGFNGSSAPAGSGTALAALVTSEIAASVAFPVRIIIDSFRYGQSCLEVRLAMSTREVLLQGIVTGFYIGFGGVLCPTAGGSLPDKFPPGLQRFVFGASASSSASS